MGTLTVFECLVSIINPRFSSCFKEEVVRYKHQAGISLWTCSCSCCSEGIS